MNRQQISVYLDYFRLLFCISLLSVNLTVGIPDNWFLGALVFLILTDIIGQTFLSEKS